MFKDQLCLLHCEELAKSLLRFYLIYLYLLYILITVFYIQSFEQQHFMPLPIWCINFSQCTHRFPPHRSLSSLLFDTALPLISRRTTTSTGGIKTRCRGLCPSELPAPLCPCLAPPRQRHQLSLTTFSFACSSHSFRYFFASFVYRVCTARSENRKHKTEI